MKTYKMILVTALLSWLSVTGFSQRVLTDGTINYKVELLNSKDKAATASFQDANFQVQVKGMQARTDLKSSLSTMTVFYTGGDKSAVILRESGNEKYMIKLTPAQWINFNKKSVGVKYTYTDETKEILGYTCKKATGVQPDGNKITVYYAVDLKTLASGYEQAFADLPGVPLEYEVESDSGTVHYTAKSLQTAPVAASRFDLPKSGYRILDYKQ